MSTVRTVRVMWHDGTLVGRVVMPGPVYFAYDEDWLQTRRDLSPLSVPFSANVYRQPSAAFDHFPGFLSDCLPDTWGRGIMISELNAGGTRAGPLAMLSWVGARGLGALRFEPEFDVNSESTWNRVSTSLLRKEAMAVVTTSPPEAFKHLRQGGSAGGTLPKATVARLPDGNLLVGGDVAHAAVLQPGATLGILKIDAPAAGRGRATDGRLEHAYLTMAAAAGLHTVQTAILPEPTEEGERHHLFVHRFDAELSTGKRFHMLTLAGAVETFSLSYSQLLAATRRLTQDHEQVKEVVRRALFNVRSLNQDDHGKNHAFLYDGDAREWRLAPAYDLTLNADSGATYHGLSVTSFGTAPNREVIRGVAADVGVTTNEFDEIDNQVASAIDRWPEFAGAAGIGAAKIDEVARLHRNVADILRSTTSHRPGKRRRRKLWE